MISADFMTRVLVRVRVRARVRVMTSAEFKHEDATAAKDKRMQLSCLFLRL